MGHTISKIRNKNKTTDGEIPPNRVRIDEDDVHVSRLKQELDENAEEFLLNNLLLSFQYFENFEREMKELRVNQVSEREMQINKALLDYKKQCLLPDTLAEIVNNRVTFKPFHGPNKDKSESLLPQRLYIVHENIEVLEPNDHSDYSTVDGPVHRAKLEKTDQEGFFYLRQIEVVDIQGGSTTETSEHNAEEKLKASSKNLQTKPPDLKLNDSSQVPARLFNKNTASPSPVVKDGNFTFDLSDRGVKSKLSRTHSLQSKTQSNVDTSKLQEPEEEDYDYTTITNIATPKPLSDSSRSRTISEASSLIDHCLVRLKVRRDFNATSSDEDDEEELTSEKEIKLDPFETRYYFDSKEFSAYFRNEFNSIYKHLGLSHDSFTSAEHIMETIISCNITGSNGEKITQEIIPAVTTPWHTLAIDWMIRKRERRNPSTMKTFQFPTKKMQAKIRQLQANVVPLGYVPKRGTNKSHNLQWCLAFPAAERYMESFLSHAQIKCYLSIIALYKTFMQPPNTQIGLAPHHIQHFIFWECEKNYTTWPDDRLGTKMIIILKNLYKNLSTGDLKDYFISDRNLFKSAPSKYLRISQKRLSEILERPAMHMLIALRNLRYKTKQFFPMISLKKIYSIISTKNALIFNNPHLIIEQNFERLSDNEEDNDTIWGSTADKNDKARNFKRKLIKQLEEDKKKKEETKKEVEEKRISEDSIDLQLPIPKPLDATQKRLLLKLFVKHFISTAIKCMDYEAHNQALFYLWHSHNLAMVLADGDSGEIEARKLKLKIKELQEKCQQEITKFQPPEVPKRDSRLFPGIQINLKGSGTLNANNLQHNVLTEEKEKREGSSDNKNSEEIDESNNIQEQKIMNDETQVDGSKELDESKETDETYDNLVADTGRGPKYSIVLDYDDESTDM